MSVVKKNVKYISDIEIHLRQQCKQALQDTVEEMAKDLHNIINKDIYKNYRPKFYKRTKWLLKNDTIQTKIFANFSANSYGAIVRIRDDNFPINFEQFQHASVCHGALSAPSFLEILNDNSKIFNNNPYGFPELLPRQPFWDDYESKWNEDYFKDRYADNLNKYVEFKYNRRKGVLERVARK